MKNRTVVLLDPHRVPHEDVRWDEIGEVTTEMSEVRGWVADRPIDVLLVDANRSDLKKPIVTRLRRYNGLLEVWLLVTGTDKTELPQYIDGRVAIGQGHDGVVRQVGQVFRTQRLLQQFGMVARSPRMKGVAETIDRIAPTEVSTLVVGPSGAGKELVARAMHNFSKRAKAPFVAINCGAIPEGLLEAELFGHEKGAFTGSVGKRDGLFSKAEGGTIFLDEIGETHPDMQVKLLRVLEDGTYYPVGSSSPKRADVRVVSATNRDLTQAIAERQFREDLYYRLGVVKIVLPPLHERKEDIQPLLQYFWREYPGLDYTDSALDLLLRYDWPGNVRQLRNFADGMAAMKPDGLVDEHDVSRFIEDQHMGKTNLPVATGKTVEAAGQELIYRAILSLGNEIKMLRELILSHLPTESDDSAAYTSQSDDNDVASVEEMEERLIRQALSTTGGNRKEAARRLGIGERTLYRKIKKYDL